MNPANSPCQQNRMILLITLLTKCYERTDQTLVVVSRMHGTVNVSGESFWLIYPQGTRKVSMLPTPEWVIDFTKLRL
jgi:hypothetical protein